MLILQSKLIKNLHQVSINLIKIIKFFRFAHAFAEVTVEKSKSLLIISDIVGWIYFLAWSVSFYPQIYWNYRRKSVVGLSFDFLSLNLLGFLMYSLFNCGLYWIPQVEVIYKHIYLLLNKAYLHYKLFRMNIFLVIRRD